LFVFCFPSQNFSRISGEERHRWCQICSVYPETRMFLLKTRFRGEGLKRPRKTGIGERICGTELKVGTQTWFQILCASVGTDWTFSSKLREFRFLGPDSEEPFFPFGLRRLSAACCVPQSEQLLIAFTTRPSASFTNKNRSALRVHR